MLRAGGHIHIPVTGLGKPAVALHLPSAGGAKVLRTGHGAQRFPLIHIVIKHFPADTTGQFRTVESVYMAFQCFAILPCALCKIQLSANQRSMVRIAQCVMGRTGRLDFKNLHSGFQRFLRGRAVGLGIKDHLGIVPAVCPLPGNIVKLQIFPQNGNIVKTPGEENKVFPAPFPEARHCLIHGNALFPQLGLLDTCQLTDPAV